MLAAFIWVVFVGFVVSVPLDDNENVTVRRLVERHVKRALVADFDEHVRQWTERKAGQINRKVSWYDLYGNHDHLSSRPQYHKYKINVHTDSIKYGDVQRSVDQPQQVFSKWYCNNQQKQPITTTISREMKRKSTYSWSTERGIKIGMSVSIAATIPGIMDINAGFSTDLDFRSAKSNSQEDSETFKIQYDLTIDPQTAVKADWIITEREIVVPYQADVQIDGYLSIWFKEKIDGHWLWFYPTSHLSGGEFRQQSNGLVYRASGIFRGIKGVDSVIRSTEYPLGSGKCNEAGQPGPGDYSLPAKITETRLPMEKYPIAHGVEGD